jgi:alpha-L-rhamnosidase
MAEFEFKQDVPYIGGAGYSFNRLEFDIPEGTVRKAIAKIVADVHTYTQDYFPEGSGLSLNTWIIAGSQIKYRIYVNGGLMGLGPARPVNKQAYMHEFDLTEACRAGQNAIGVLSLGESHGFAMVVDIEMEDDTSRRIATGGDWKSLPGADIFRPVCWEHPGVDCYRKGCTGPGELPEHIDGRLFPDGWSEVGFDDSNWHPARTFGSANDKYAVTDIANLTFYRIHPEKIVKLNDGHFFFDFGKEVIAGISLNVPAAEESFALRLGEECWAENRVRYMLRTENYYEEIWTPSLRPMTLEHFGLRAFRYGEVFGWPGELHEQDISAVVLHYPFDDNAATFDSSSEVLNDVWNLCKYSIKATNMDIYQDATRERHAYEGDSYINMLCHYALDPDIRLARHTAEFLIYHPTWPAEWVMLMINIFWADYMQTGDPSMIEKYYDHLRDVCSFHHNLEDGLRTDFPTRVLVDWPQSQRDDYDFGPASAVPNAYMHENLVLLSRMAKVLGRDNESAQFLRLSSQVAEAYNRRLFDESTSLYVDHEGSNHSSFHANLFPLVFGLVPEERKRGCLDFLKTKGMSCSVYTSQFFLDALYANNEAEYALSLMTAKSGNSWGHMMYDLSATIVTESWDPEQKINMSWAHPWAASPVNIIPRRLFGIRPIEAGWQKFSIDPKPGGLAWAKIKVPTPKGSMSASYEVNDQGETVLSFTVPQGCTALVGGKEYVSDARITLMAR